MKFQTSLLPESDPPVPEDSVDPESVREPEPARGPDAAPVVAVQDDLAEGV